VVSRVNFLETEPKRIADVARVVREIVHPGIRDETGYVGYIVLGDRETGNAVGVTLWESEEAREASDTKAPSRLAPLNPASPSAQGASGGVGWLDCCSAVSALAAPPAPSRISARRLHCDTQL
jgi:quinol monooxygenase YgiN